MYWLLWPHSQIPRPGVWGGVCLCGVCMLPLCLWWALSRHTGHVMLGSISLNLVFLLCLLWHYAPAWLRTLSQIVDDQVESGFRDDINQRRQHLQSPLTPTKHHLQQHMGQTWQCVKRGTAVTRTRALIATIRPEKGLPGCDG